MKMKQKEKKPEPTKVAAQFQAYRRLMTWNASVHDPSFIPTGEYESHIVNSLRNLLETFRKKYLGGEYHLTHEWEMYFFWIVLYQELEKTSWGKCITQSLEDKGHMGFKPFKDKNIYVSKMPFFLLPTECVSCGESLELTASDLYNKQKRIRFKHQEDHPEHGYKCWQLWKDKRSVFKEIYACFDSIVPDGKQHFNLNLISQEFEKLWRAYRFLVSIYLESHNGQMRPYTPRYTLLASYTHMNHDWFQRFLFREPLNLAHLTMFKQEVDGKIIAPLENELGQPVNNKGQILSDPYISLKRLEDYFILPKLEHT